MSTNQNGQLEFEDKLWLMADKLRNNIDAAEYKHVVLGLLFLKYISDAFEEQYERLSKEEYADPEDRDEYTAQNIFWVPREARWSVLKTNAKKPEIGQIIDNAMVAIEKENKGLKGVLPKNYARPELDKTKLGSLLTFSFKVGIPKAGPRTCWAGCMNISCPSLPARRAKGREFYTPVGS